MAKAKANRGGFGMALLSLGAAAAIALSSCSSIATFFNNLFPDPYAGYDSTTNLISGIDFSSSTRDLSSSGYETPAKWTWSWRGATDAGTFDYMSLAEAGTVGETVEGLDSSAGAYLLSLENLMPATDSDFEGVTDLSSTVWTNEDVSTSWTLESANSSSYHGTKSLKISDVTSLSSQKAIRFPLVKIDDYGTSSTAHTYSCRAYAKSSSVLYWGILASSSAIEATTTTQNSSFQLLATSVSDLVDCKKDILDLDLVTTPHDLAFGYSSPVSGYVDDIRILRAVLDKGSYSLRLLLRASDTSPVLPTGGIFEFSVWVRKPEGSYFVSEQAAKNPFAASNVTLEMRQLDPDGGAVKTTQHVFPITGEADTDTNSYDAASGWVKLTLRMKASTDAFDFTKYEYGDDNPRIELAIYPTNYNDLDSGSVRIAGPELHFYSDGY